MKEENLDYKNLKEIACVKKKTRKMIPSYTGNT
jgi:hypothetical protein